MEQMRFVARPARLRRLGLILLLLAMAPTANASTQQLLNFQLTLETRIAQIVRAFDKSAFVVVEAEEKKDKQALPLSSLLIETNQISKNKGDIRLDKLLIRIYLTEGHLPAALRSLITSLTADYGTTPKLVVRELSRLTESTHEPVVLPPVKPPVAIEELAEKVLAHTAGAIRYLRGWLRATEISLVAVLLFFGIGFQALVQAAREIARQLRALSSRSPLPAPLSPHLSAIPPLAGRLTRLALPDAGILELLADAYWSEMDDYGAFLVARMTAGTKLKLMAKARWVGPYLDYVSGLAPKDHDRERETAYLNPLPLFQINNQKLTEIVREYPALFSRLSSIRRENVQLRVSERLLLWNHKPPILPEPSQLSAMAASPSRDLTASSRGWIRDAEEENELLTEREIPDRILRAIPTLAWATFLSEQRLTEILSEYSAQQLADSWVGPVKVLDYFSRCLPPKKLAAVRSLAAAGGADRGTDAYRALSRSIVDE